MSDTFRYSRARQGFGTTDEEDNREVDKTRSPTQEDASLIAQLGPSKKRRREIGPLLDIDHANGRSNMTMSKSPYPWPAQPIFEEPEFYPKNDEGRWLCVHEKPCAKTFADWTSVRRHVRTVHLKLKDYYCEICYKDNSDPRRRDSHIENPQFEKCHAAWIKGEIMTRKEAKALGLEPPGVKPSAKVQSMSTSAASLQTGFRQPKMRRHAAELEESMSYEPQLKTHGVNGSFQYAVEYPSSNPDPYYGRGPHSNLTAPSVWHRTPPSPPTLAEAVNPRALHPHLSQNFSLNGPRLGANQTQEQAEFTFRPSILPSISQAQPAGSFSIPNNHPTSLQGPRERRSKKHGRGGVGNTGGEQDYTNQPSASAASSGRRSRPKDPKASRRPHGRNYHVQRQEKMEGPGVQYAYPNTTHPQPRPHGPISNFGPSHILGDPSSFTFPQVTRDSVCKPDGSVKYDGGEISSLGPQFPNNFPSVPGEFYLGGSSAFGTSILNHHGRPSIYFDNSVDLNFTKSAPNSNYNFGSGYGLDISRGAVATASQTLARTRLSSFEPLHTSLAQRSYIQEETNDTLAEAETSTFDESSSADTGSHSLKRTDPLLVFVNLLQNSLDKDKSQKMYHVRDEELDKIFSWNTL